MQIADESPLSREVSLYRVFFTCSLEDLTPALYREAPRLRPHSLIFESHNVTSCETKLNIRQFSC
jgi:hypothetical protein